MIAGGNSNHYNYNGHVNSMQQNIYGQILSKTPKAMNHLLDQCIYTIGRTTYVDFFPFYDLNCTGSELNLLEVFAALNELMFI